MKKLLLSFIVSIVALTLSSCGDEPEIIDVKLIKGQWEVVSADSPAYTCIYDFTTQNDHTWSWGTLTVYYLTTEGAVIYDRFCSWSVSDPENYDEVYLEITLLGLLDSPSTGTESDRYIVEKLTDKEMVLKKSEAGDSGTRLRLIRRNDLPQH